MTRLDDFFLSKEKELRELATTMEEIKAYAEYKEKRNEDHGVVSYGKPRFSIPTYHDTWKIKVGGRKHIDIGYIEEIHLMLGKEETQEFIDFIKKRRE